MRTKLLTITATGVVGLVLGAGIGVAAAGPDGTDEPAANMTMEEVHATMRDAMPAELAEQCDAMHAAMPEAMRRPGHGAMASMMGGTGAAHDQHHDNG